MERICHSVQEEPSAYGFDPDSDYEPEGRKSQQLDALDALSSRQLSSAFCIEGAPFQA
jgi:hypothetical protein